jgi:hypothetical protein
MASLPSRRKSPTRGFPSAQNNRHFSFCVLDTPDFALCGMSGSQLSRVRRRQVSDHLQSIIENTRKATHQETIRPEHSIHCLIWTITAGILHIEALTYS